MKHTPDGYETLNDGKILSIMYNWRGYGIRELEQTANSFGYKTVRLTVAGKRKRYFVHKLVASKYLPPRPSLKHQLRHKDGNKFNNNVRNLMWGTAKDNADDREKHGRTSRGSKHSIAVRNGLRKRGFNVKD